jgi:hypothetical protein
MARVLPRSLRLLDRIGHLPAPVVGWAFRLYRSVESAIPAPLAVVDWIRDVDPDVVVVSPLVTDASAQTDVVKAAQALEIPVGLLVASWDHLTSKGLIRVVPDRVVVWNAIQREEAVELHGVPPAAVVVTGAQPFDRWFARQPRLDMDAFAARVGLPPGPFVLFVGSTASISEPEAELTFVTEWLAAIRTSGDARLRDISVLVRPHPYNLGLWQDADISKFGPAAVWPRHNANPVNEDDREDYFLSLKYSSAVVGINTSAMVEAAIQGKPVLTIRTPRFRDTQDLTVHFSYLLPDNGGFVRAATSLDEHLRQLADATADRERASAAATRFVESFVRPNGLDAPATPQVVRAIEDLSSVDPLPAVAPSAGARLVASTLAAVARRVDARTARRRPPRKQDRVVRNAADPAPQPPVGERGGAG